LGKQIWAILVRGKGYQAIRQGAAKLCTAQIQYNGGLTMPFHPKAILFDAYGTLFDVYSVSALAQELFPGKGEALARMWRDKQVEYTRLRSMAGQYKPFSEITAEALQFCGEALGLAMTPQASQALLGQYSRLAAFSENLAALKRIKAGGVKVAIHSNGNPEMLACAVSSAGMNGIFDAVLSAHSVGRYKVDPAVYQLAVDHFSLPAQDMLFVSSNGWDICGAAWFGFKTFWVNRAGAPAENLGVTPTFVGKNLTDVADQVNAVRAVRFV
jgi:2-haloacid dehalogenase